MANDRFMQAWFNFSDSEYLEASSVSQFNAGGDFVASVLFKVPGTAFPDVQGSYLGFLPPSQFALLWGNLEVAGGDPFDLAGKGWALALSPGSQNQSLAVIALIGGHIIAGECILADPSQSNNFGHELADRLILASMHYYRLEGEVQGPPTVDLYVNGNRIASRSGPGVTAYTASTKAPRVGACETLANAFAKGIEIVGTSYLAIDPLFGPLSLNMPTLMAEQFRATRQNNKLGLLAPTLDAAHRYNASGSQQDASGVKLIRLPNPTVPAFGYNATPRAVSAPDTGNQGAVALPGVTAVPLAVAGTVNVRTTQNPNWYTQVSPLIAGLT